MASCASCNQVWSAGTQFCPICKKECVSEHSKIDDLCLKYLNLDSFQIMMGLIFYWIFAIWIVIANEWHINSIIVTLIGNILFVVVILPRLAPSAGDLQSTTNDGSSRQPRVRSLYYNQSTGRVEHIIHNGEINAKQYIRTVRNNDGTTKQDYFFKVK